MDTTRLRSLIEKSGKTQKEIAADLKLSQQRFNYYVNGQREPDIATIKQLAIYFSVSIDYLLGRDDMEHTLRTREPISILFSLYSITVQQFANISGLSRSAVERLSIVATPLNGKYDKNPLYDLISVEQYKRINDFFLVDLTKRDERWECELPLYPNKKVVDRIRHLVEQTSPSADVSSKLAELERKSQDMDARIAAIEGNNAREDIARMEAAAELSASPSVYAGISNPVKHGE